MILLCDSSNPTATGHCRAEVEIVGSSKHEMAYKIAVATFGVNEEEKEEDALAAIPAETSALVSLFSIATC